MYFILINITNSILAERIQLTYREKHSYCIVT